MPTALFTTHNDDETMSATGIKSQAKTLTVFSLVMITIVSVDSIRNLPATAMFGSTLIFFFVVAAIFFLIPTALVSAELASGWAEQGGVYIWVKAAFSEQYGFLAIWFQWIENVIWYPTILSFVAGTLGYLINPALANNHYFIIAVILATFWGATCINLFGMRLSAAFSTFCSISGLIIPMSLIIGLAAVWMFTGHKLQIGFSMHEILPDLHHPDIWVALTGITLSFCGMEIATVHARDVANPQRSFPKALLISTVIILATLIFGGLAIAIVLPESDINLIAGIMQAFDAFFTTYHAHWMLPVVAVMLVIGVTGGMSNWIIAPTKGLVVAAQQGNLPQFLQRENKHGAPTPLLITQAILVSLLTLVFLLFPSVNASYWLLTALASQLYMLMYLLMFAALIKLRYSQPDRERVFKIPGGMIGVYLVIGCGVIGALGTFCIGFIPPSQLHLGGTRHYLTLLLSGLALMSIPPFLLHRFKRSSWLSAQDS